MTTLTATGQEKLANGTLTGTSTNPLFVAPGGGGTIGNANLLNTLSAYKLQSTSPLKNTAMNLVTTFG